MHRRPLIFALVASILVAALATPALAAVVIRTSGQTWSPTRVVVQKGTRVVWRATSGTHNVRAYGGNWTFDQDISFSGDPTAAKTFRRVGRFKFRCRFHSTLTAGVCSGMCGRVRVIA